MTLAKRFQTNQVPSKERFLYFLTFLMVGTLILSSFSVHLLVPESSNQWDLVKDCLYLVFSLLGSIFLFKINEKGDGKHFIERYICLSFPVMFQTILLTIGMTIASTAIQNVLGNMDQLLNESMINDVIIVFLSQVYMYWRLYKGFKLASSGSIADPL